MIRKHLNTQPQYQIKFIEILSSYIQKCNKLQTSILNLTNIEVTQQSCESITLRQQIAYCLVEFEINARFLYISNIKQHYNFLFYILNVNTQHCTVTLFVELKCTPSLWVACKFRYFRICRNVVYS